jgi:ribosomal protein S6
MYFCSINISYYPSYIFTLLFLLFLFALLSSFPIICGHFLYAILFSFLRYERKILNPQETMRQYELMMILDPSLAESDRTALIADIETELAQAGAKVVTADHPGERELAYRIHGSTTGYYLLYTLDKESGDFQSAISAFNIKTNIWRHMFVRLDD